MRFPFFKFRAIYHYLLALVLLYASVGILFFLREILGAPLVALLFLLPVGLSTTFWGLGPGIMTAIFTFLSFNFFFIPPYYTFAVYHPRDVLMLVVFLVVAVVLSQLVGRAQAGLAAATAREREATKLYELSTALAGLQNNESIVRVFSDQLLQTFNPEYLDFSVRQQSSAPKIRIGFPLDSAQPVREPEWIIPLQTARGSLGEIRLWKLGPFTRAEERLLKTFASQGAIALERGWLVEAETRSKVLEESDRLKSALLSSVSHELRTPLATIKASVTSLRSGEVAWESTARDELLAAVDDEADHLNRLVGNLLDMSRIESGALKPKLQWNLIGEILSGVIARMRQSIVNHRLVIDIPEALPLVPVDYVQMEQVFSNLISNSLKYAPAGTTIAVRARREKDSTLLVEVSNQGPPVPEEHLNRIFDKFYRVTAADRVTGTGLGLSICKGIIEAHGGRIWAENLSAGLAFKFTLPLQREGVMAPDLPSDAETR